MATKLRLTFTGKKHSFSQPLVARISLGDHAITNHDEHLLSADCVSFRELESEVNLLKSQLDQILIRAKKKFAV